MFMIKQASFEEKPFNTYLKL